MTAHTAVGVDDDLATRESGITDGAADDEASGRVDVHVVVVVGELCRDDRLDDVLDEIGTDHAVPIDAVVVLGRDQHGRKTDRNVVLVFKRDLGLAIGAQVRNGARLAHLREAFRHAVRDVDRHRHQDVGLVARVPKHHALVASTLLIEIVFFAGAAGANLFGVIHTLSDVGRLLIDRDHHAASVSIEAERLTVITDAVDGFANDRGDVDVCLRGDLARDHRKARRDERFARDTTHRVLLEDRVENRIRNLIGHLVRMSFGDGLRREAVVVGHGWLSPE